MHDRQARALTTIRAIDGFLTQFADHFPRAAASGLRQRLRDTIDDLDAYIAAQAGDSLTSRALTQRHLRLRDALLRDHMAPIVRLARVIGYEEHATEPLRMPIGAPSVALLIAHAKAMAALVEPHAESFIALGRSPTFIAELLAAADALTDCVSLRDQKRASSAGATAGLDDRLRFARRIVHALDAMVQSELQDDSPLIAGWMLIKHVQAKPGPRRERGPAASSDTIALPIRDPRRLLAAASDVYAGLLPERSGQPARDSRAVVDRPPDLFDRAVRWRETRAST